MTTDSEHWRRVEQLYHSALEQAPANRDAFLAAACGDDAVLRREVESLLEQTSGSFLSKPFAQATAAVGENGQFQSQSLGGRHLGSYQIVAGIGKGGMGEVWRAKDTKLGREVAIKVLPPEFGNDAERLLRFRREAKLLAALNHPNIATIYGLEESGGLHFLVMELVEGRTLAERIQDANENRAGQPAGSSAIPVLEALKIGQQIAEALDHAHERRVIHRDLKPGNVMLTAQGRVKVLDFGLAKALADDGMDSTQPATLSVLPTEPGRIMGTPAYMSPEQAQGKAVDMQTDIWAFGCVLYELLTGEPAFCGENTSQTIAALLRNDPNWQALPANTPVTVRTLLHRCLQKDQNRRLHSAADLALQLEDALATPGSPSSNGSSITVPTRRNVRERLAWSVAGVALIVAVISSVAGRLQAPAVAKPMSVFLPVAENATLVNWFSPIVSPDGSRIAFLAIDASGKGMIWVRSLDSFDAKPIDGTEDADSPFWSPDGRYLGFFADRKLKKVDLMRNTVQTLSDAPTGRGGAWNKDGVILFAPRSGSVLHTVSADGGVSTPLTTIETPEDAVGGHRYPHFHPDGRHFAFWVSGRVAVGSLDSKESKKLLPFNSEASFAPDGSLLYVSGETLVAQPFDVDRMELTGRPLPVATRVARYEPWGNADFSISDNGVLAYRLAGFARTQLTWVDREGKKLGAIGNAENYSDILRLSPDGKRVTASRRDAQTGSLEIWLLELSRGVETRLNSEVSDGGNPVWSPDGSQIAFSSSHNGRLGIYVKTLITGKQELLLETEDTLWPKDWSRDGKLLTYTSRSQESFDVGLLDFTDGRKHRPFAHTSFTEDNPSFSPDGHWLAYHSNESGRDELYMRSLQTEAESIRISANGSDSGHAAARWRADGKELFYLAPDQTMVAVPIEKGSKDAIGRAQSLFTIERNSGAGSFDVTPDGQRFLITSPAPRVDSSMIAVVLNWPTSLKK